MEDEKHYPIKSHVIWILFYICFVVNVSWTNFYLVTYFRNKWYIYKLIHLFPFSVTTFKALPHLDFSHSIPLANILLCDLTFCSRSSSTPSCEIGALIPKASCRGFSEQIPHTSLLQWAFSFISGFLMICHCVSDFFIILEPTLAPKYKLHEVGTWAFEALEGDGSIQKPPNGHQLWWILWGLLFRQPDKCWHILFPKHLLQCPFSISTSSSIVFPAAARVYCFISYGSAVCCLGFRRRTCHTVLISSCPYLSLPRFSAFGE